MLGRAVFQFDKTFNERRISDVVEMFPPGRKRIFLVRKNQTGREREREIKDRHVALYGPRGIIECAFHGGRMFHGNYSWSQPFVSYWSTIAYSFVSMKTTYFCNDSYTCALIYDLSNWQKDRLITFSDANRFQWKFRQNTVDWNLSNKNIMFVNCQMRIENQTAFVV